MGNKVDTERLRELSEPTKEATELQDMIFRGLEKRIERDKKRLMPMIEELCHTRVVPPIKGEITAGKVRWRGLSLAFVSYPVNEEKYPLRCIGISQRDNLLTFDGTDDVPPVECCSLF